MSDIVSDSAFSEGTHSPVESLISEAIIDHEKIYRMPFGIFPPMLQAIGGFPYYGHIPARTISIQNMETPCFCPNNIFKDIKALQGFRRLDVLSLLLDSYIFKMPFKGYMKNTQKRKRSRSKSLPPSIRKQDDSNLFDVCAATSHLVYERSILYSLEELKKNILAAGKFEDAKSIKEMLVFASPSDMKQICENLCDEKPEHSFVSRVIVGTIIQKYSSINRGKYAIVKIWTGFKTAPKPYQQFAEYIPFDRYQPFDRYRKSRGINTLVVVVEQNVQRQVGSFWGLDLIVVSKNERHQETESLLPYEFCDSTDSSIINIEDDTFVELFKNHSNITLINKSNVRSQGYKTIAAKIERTPTIVIYCEVKGVVPIGEKPFPTKINGFQVDVREGSCHLATKTLRFGERIKDEFRKSGTLGGFVDLQDPHRTAFISCAHVVLPTEILRSNSHEEYVRRKEAINIYDTEKKEIGRVEKLVFKHGRPNEVSTDAALIEITNRHPADGYFADVFLENQLNGAGFTDAKKLHFSNGQIEQINFFNFRNQIIKVGASSGITLGSLRIGRSGAQIMNECDVTMDNSIPIRLFGQLEVIPRIDPTQPSDARQSFIDEGDSGALVFAIKNENPIVLKCIGIAVARTSYGACLMTPIDKVFDALGLPYNCFSKFSVPRSGQETEALQSMLMSITQQLTTMSSNMATKSDIQNTNESLERNIQNTNESLGRDIHNTNVNIGRLKNDLEQFNERLAKAEKNIERTRKTGKDKDGQ